MKNCGKRFHNEVGKFRFLNELIKVVSPKYLGTRAPEKVKTKVLELMFSWTVGLPDELKITEAYHMLKKQGIIKQDPVLPDDELLPPPPPRSKNAMFEDEEKSKLLARLLKSSHPEDLRAANKLIKEMVQEDQKRMEKISKRVNAIEEVNNNVKLLSEMLENYSKDETSESNEEIMKELYQRCEKMRPTLFRLASDTEDNDEALAEILQANDNLTQVINMYKKIVKGEEVNGMIDLPNIKASSSALLDLSGLDTGSNTPYPAAPANQTWNPDLSQDLSSSVSLLDDELMSLGLNDLVPNAVPSSHSLESSNWNTFQSSEPDDAAESSALASELLKPAASTACQQNPACVPASTGSKALDDLDMLGKTLLQQSLPPESQQVKWSAPQQRQTLRDLQNKSSTNPAVALGTPPLFPTSSKGISPILTSATLSTGLAPQPEQSLAFAYTSSLPPASAGAPSTGQPGAQHSAQGGLRIPSVPQQEISLTNVVVPLESIKPSSILPVTVYDKNSFRVLFHFAKDPPPGQPDVLVVVTSMISTAPQPVKNIRFQAAVPKIMKVKLQPPSGTELSAFNPILPPSAITQVLLLANPQKDKVRLRYKLTFTLGEQTFNEMGDVDQFPAPESWGNL
uniref:ADP-ribosylation factor-binding protein GGA1-like n=1 Tax=Pristiophorus japonicus TaxID=55135 RepID=UPI00398F0372